MTIPNLPIELISVIGDSVSMHDAKALRLACRQFSFILAPRIFHRLTLDFNQSNYELEIDKLRTLASGRCLATNLTKTLRISSLSPYEHPNVIFGEPNTMLHPSAARVELSVLAIAEAHILEHLGPALSALKDVHAVHWQPRPGRDVAGTYAIVNSFLSRIHIDTLSVGFEPMYGPRYPNSDTSESLQIPFETMSIGLKSINIWDIDEPLDGDDLVHNLSRFIGRFEHLHHLALGVSEDQFWDMTDIQRDLLTTILNGIPASSTPLRLTEIELTHSIPRIQYSPYIVRHLRHLTYVRFDLPVHLSHENTCESLMHDFWDTLKRERIYLEIIETTAPVLSLLEYLESFSGLKKLKFCIGCWPAPSPTAGHHFFTHVLPLHSASLQYLHICDIWGESGWALTEGTASILSTCKNLQKLSVMVEGLQMVNKALQLGNLPAVIDTFLGLPQLRKLRVEFSEPCGYYERRESVTQKAICLAVGGLSVPTTKHSGERLWSLRVGEDVFLPVLDATQHLWEWVHEKPDDDRTYVEWEDASDREHGY